MMLAVQVRWTRIATNMSAKEFWCVQTISSCRRTLLLAGVAAALIFGGLALKQLNDSRGKKTFTAVDPHSMHDHGPDEPCGESCSKDHKPDEHPLNIMVGMRRPILSMHRHGCYDGGVYDLLRLADRGSARSTSCSSSKQVEQA